MKNNINLKAKNINNVVDTLLAMLNDKQRSVIEGRYGLSGNREAKTLESIGQGYGITRERVRQIQNASETKLQEAVGNIEEYNNFIDLVKSQLEKVGGVRRDEVLYHELSHLLGAGHKDNYQPEYFFLLSLTPENLNYQDEDDNYHAVWFLTKDNFGAAEDFLKDLVGYLTKNRVQVVQAAENWSGWVNACASKHKLSEASALNYLSLSKKIHLNSFGELGLMEWPEIKPANIADAIHLVLRKSDNSLHFSKIAEAVNKVYHKQVSPQSVHNELIRSDRFTLLNRGIYVIKSDSVLPPIVKDAIHKILKDKGPLPKDKIFSLIKSQKPVKDNTIALALCNRKMFKRLDDGRYSIA